MKSISNSNRFFFFFFFFVSLRLFARAQRTATDRSNFITERGSWESFVYQITRAKRIRRQYRDAMFAYLVPASENKLCADYYGYYRDLYTHSTEIEYPRCIFRLLVPREIPPKNDRMRINTRRKEITGTEGREKGVCGHVSNFWNCCSASRRWIFLFRQFLPRTGGKVLRSQPRGRTSILYSKGKWKEKRNVTRRIAW